MHAEYTKRERRMSILLSEDEQLIVDRYLEKYKITNKIILPSSENMI